MASQVPVDRCESCGGLLVAPAIVIGFKAPPEAAYVCMRCGRPYRWTDDPPRLVTIGTKIIPKLG